MLLMKFVCLAIFSRGIQAELKLLSVVFRHGDRAPDNKDFESYPNDPYANETFFPIGEGGLTNTGKMREYRLGQYLRKTYGNYLGPFYYKGILSARSTYIERTKLSLQLVLAGLYPPKGNQTWNKEITWQPIPTHYVRHLDDVLMYNFDCPRLIETLKLTQRTSKYKKELNEFEPLMKNLTVVTGRTIKSSLDMNFLYHGLVAIQGLNLELPQWTKGLYPRGELYEGTLLSYKLFGYTDKMRRLYGGVLLRRITDDMTAACEGKVQKPKLFLWSGHDFNIATLLQAMNLYKPHVPRFSSAIIFELHKENSKCFVKVKYYKGIVRPSDENRSMVQKMSVPGVKTSSIEEFKAVLKNHIATNDDITSCDKRSMPEFLKRHPDFAGDETNVILRAIEMEKQNQPNLE